MAKSPSIWRRLLDAVTVERREIEWPFDVGAPSNVPNIRTDDQALRLHSVFAAVRLLADSVSCLPLHVYRLVDDRRVKVPGATVFDEPSAVDTPFDWVYKLMTSTLIHGDAFGMVTSRDRFLHPTNVEWLKTASIYVDESKSTIRPEIFYEGKRIDNLDDVFVVRGFVRAGRFRGLSPIEVFAESIGRGLAAAQYGGDWYANGGFPPGTMKNNKKTVPDKESREIRARLTRAIRAREPLVYGEEWDYNAVAIPPEQAQFLGAMRLNAAQIASIYDVPPERVGGEPGGSLTYATQEQDQIRLALTVQKWCTRLEYAFARLLPRGQYARFNIDAMIRTDLKTRHEVFQIDRTIGLKSVDELRALDDLAPLPDGAGASYLPLQAVIAESQPRPTTIENEATPGAPPRLKAVGTGKD